MRISEIASAPDRGGRHRVTFSDGTVMKLLPSVIADLGLYTGRELSEEDMEEVARAARKADAKMRAVRVISATTVSRRDLQERLRHKGASEEDASEAVQWLEELNLLDDAQAARQIVARGVRRGYGEKRIRQMLYEKKIPREYWEDALSEIPPMDDAVDEFLRSRLRGEPDQKDLRRTIDALLRRGFSWNEIKDGLRRYDAALAGTMEEE